MNSLTQAFKAYRNKRLRTKYDRSSDKPAFSHRAIDAELIHKIIEDHTIDDPDAPKLESIQYFSLLRNKNILPEDAAFLYLKLYKNDNTVKLTTFLSRESLNILASQDDEESSKAYKDYLSLAGWLGGRFKYLPYFTVKDIQAIIENLGNGSQSNEFFSKLLKEKHNSDDVLMEIISSEKVNLILRERAYDMLKKSPTYMFEENLPESWTRFALGLPKEKEEIDYKKLSEFDKQIYKMQNFGVK